MATTKSTRSKAPPWKKAAPKRARGKKKTLSAAQKKKARASAKRAGRPYPNLVDNMNAAQNTKTKKTKKRKAS